MELTRAWYDIVRQEMYGSRARCGKTDRKETEMLAERLEVRLDSEHRRRLVEIATLQGKPISDIVRDLIDHAYDEVDRVRRVRAARELGQLTIEDVPEPVELSRQLEGTFELPDLY